jgi:hypothetical protein
MAELRKLCKDGRLFDVQAWIAAGKPVNPPYPPVKGKPSHSPLDVAVDLKFHSMVQVLLEAGAVQDLEHWNPPIYRALHMRRLDIVKLFIDNGFDPKAVDMSQVFATWDPKIMNYFIEFGPELIKGRPFAYALCERIRTVLNVYKTCRKIIPELQEQADIALRHHCREGNIKWVSLMLWAGADPFKPGPDDPGQVPEEEDEEGMSAVGLAAFYKMYDVFSLKPIRTKLPGPNPHEYISDLAKGKGLEILQFLLQKGLNPNDQENGGCSAIERCLGRMSWDWSVRHIHRLYLDSSDKNSNRLDTREARDQIKAIHLLSSYGAKWKPLAKSDIDYVRRSLLKLIPEYTVEFVWIMSRFRAASRESIEQLLRTSSIKSHTSAHRERLQQLMTTI